MYKKMIKICTLLLTLAIISQPIFASALAYADEVENLDIESYMNSWHDDEIEKFFDLMAENRRLFASMLFEVDTAYHIIRYHWLSIDRDVDLMYPILGIPFGKFTSDEISIFEDIVSNFLTVEHDSMNTLSSVLNHLITFEDAYASIITSNNTFLQIQVQLFDMLDITLSPAHPDDPTGPFEPEIIEDPDYIWSLEEVKQFNALIDETYDIWNNLTLLLGNIENLLSTVANTSNVIEDFFNFNSDELITLNLINERFQALTAHFWEVWLNAELRLISFDEALGLISLRDELVAIRIEVRDIFDTPMWTEADWITINELYAENFLITDLLSHAVDLAWRLMQYHSLSQNSNLDLVQIIFGWDLTDEDILEIQDIITTFVQLVIDSQRLVSSIIDNLLSIERASTLLITNTSEMVALLSQVENFLSSLENRQVEEEAIELLRGLLIKIDELQLNETDFTSESWGIFISALDAALEALESDEGYVHLAAYENLKEAFEGLERIVVVEKVHIVSFNLNGGSGNFPAQNVNDEELATAPSEIPTKQNYKFLGWFTAEVGDEVFDFNIPIIADTIIHAQWERSNNDDDSGNVGNNDDDDHTGSIDNNDNEGNRSNSIPPRLPQTGSNAFQHIILGVVFLASSLLIGHLKSAYN